MPTSQNALIVSQDSPIPIFSDADVYAYIGEHFTENYPDYITWKRMIYHLFRACSEQKGLPFTQRVRDLLIAGNGTKRGVVLMIFHNATAAVRLRNPYLMSHEPDVYEEEPDEDDDE